MVSMSAIDFYCSVDKVKGVDGKDRVVVTFDGKFLPYSEQVSSCIFTSIFRESSICLDACIKYSIKGLMDLSS